MNGIITVSGNIGKNGEGGGAGGSLIINATSFYGNGYITANGGDGGFSGGLISGRMLFYFFITYLFLILFWLSHNYFEVFQRFIRFYDFRLFIFNLSVSSYY